MSTKSSTTTDVPAGPLTYSSYLMMPELLDLQQPRSSPVEHDELLFIIIHQSYELWFKQMLHELDKAKRDFSNNNLYGAIATFQRLRTVMKMLVGKLDILETMSPMSFSSFRDRLETSSGFQSSQFREFEFVLGMKRQEVLKYHPADSPGHAQVHQRLHERTVIDHFYDFLEANTVSIPAKLRDKDETAPNVADKKIQDQLLGLYESRPDLVILFELMTDFDEGLQEWRYRHVKIVERTIGAKHGTGGSLGVEYLKRALFVSVFPDLWAVRHRM